MPMPRALRWSQGRGRFLVSEVTLYLGLGRNLKRFRGGLVFKAHKLLYHSTLGSRVVKKKKRSTSVQPIWAMRRPASPSLQSRSNASATPPGPGLRVEG